MLHGKLAFDTLLTVLTGGEIGAVKFARLVRTAVKEGPEALAGLIKSTIKNAKNLEIDPEVLNSGFPKLRKKIGGQIVGEGPDSTILGKNLEAAGFSRPANTAAHHMVPGKDKRGSIVRKILQREGIDINLTK